MLASIINSSDEAIISISLDATITSWNRGAAILFGYTAPEALGKEISMLIAPDRWNEEAGIIRRITKGEFVEHYETERIRKNGSIVQISLNVAPIRDPDGQIIGASKIARNTTEAKLAEAKIKESENIYKTIASSIPGAVICLFDPEYRYLLIEGDMLEKLGYRKNLLLGQRVRDVVSAERFEEVKNEFARVFRGETFSSERRVEDYDIISRYVPLKNENEEVYNAMVVLIDVTELKIAQRFVGELNITLERKVADRTEQLAAVNKELEAFTYSVSHDLRAPLRIIDGFADTLLTDYGGKLDEEGHRTVGVIMTNARRMGQLIDDLLNLSRLGKREILRSRVDMNPVVSATIEELLLLYKGQQPRIDCDQLLSAQCDSSLIRQVWSNLISNALKYSGKQEQPVIRIGSYRDGSNVVYSVTDNGVGFNMKYAGKLFGVFQRLHKVTEFEGTGVGLALVQRIILKHGGRVWAESEPGKGAKFFFSLPEEIPLQ